MLLQSKTIDRTTLATDIAALLEERDPLGRDAGIDINLRIEALRRHRTYGKQGKRFDNLEKAARSYRKLLNTSEDNGVVDGHATGQLLTYAYPERIAKARNDGRGTFQLANGKRAVVPEGDDLAHETWLAVAALDARDGVGKIFLASTVDPDDLEPLTHKNERIVWDTKKGGIVATKDRRIGQLTLQSAPLPQAADEVVIPVIYDAIRAEGAQLLTFSEAVTQWQNRVLSLRCWYPDQGWPDVTTATLLAHPERWLAPYLPGIRKIEELHKLDIRNILTHSLSYEQQQALVQLAPPTLAVPSGSTVNVQYSALGESPVLAVRLQEVFGMLDTPRINDGQTPVLMHLLSPGFKPVQVTADLRSFWQTTYFEVRKELKRRYPKHAWPEDPLLATAVRGVPGKSQKNT